MKIEFQNSVARLSFLFCITDMKFAWYLIPEYKIPDIYTLSGYPEIKNIENNLNTAYNFNMNNKYAKSIT